MWNKIKTFAKGALNYLPRGILYSAGFMVLSGVIESATGYTGFPTLGVTAKTGAEVLRFAAFSLGLGSVISGVGTVIQESRQHNAAIEAEAAGQEQGRSVGPERQRQRDYAEPHSPQANLPRSVSTKPQSPAFPG